MNVLLEFAVDTLAWTEHDHVAVHSGARPVRVHVTCGAHTVAETDEPLNDGSRCEKV
jgi:hypothetical protein